MIALAASPAEQEQARGYIDHLRDRNYDAIERGLRADLRTPGLRQSLAKMADMVPAGEPQSVRTVGAQKSTRADTTLLNLTFEYEFAAGWLVANVATEARNGERFVVAFNVYPRARSLRDEHRFTLAGKRGMHYVVLGTALAVFAVTVLAFYRCARTRNLSRKPLWIVFILVGFGQLAIDWTSGAWRLALLHLQLFGAGATAAPDGPWWIMVSLPVGALVFLLRAGNGTLTLKPVPADPGVPGGPAR